MKSRREVIVTIRAIQRLRAAKSFHKASALKAVRKATLENAAIELNHAQQKLAQADSEAGMSSRLMYSQLAVLRHPFFDRQVKDAASYLSLAKHENNVALELEKRRRKELAWAQGALDAAKRVAGRQLRQDQARQQCLDDTRTLEQWMNRRCTKTGHGV